MFRVISLDDPLTQSCHFPEPHESMKKLCVFRGREDKVILREWETIEWVCWRWVSEGEEGRGGRLEIPVIHLRDWRSWKLLKVARSMPK